MKDAGYNIRELRDAGFTLKELESVGFDFDEAYIAFVFPQLYEEEPSRYQNKSYNKSCNCQLNSIS